MQKFAMVLLGRAKPAARRSLISLYFNYIFCLETSLFLKIDFVIFRPA